MSVKYLDSFYDLPLIVIGYGLVVGVGELLTVGCGDVEGVGLLDVLGVGDVVDVVFVELVGVWVLVVSVLFDQILHPPKTKNRTTNNNTITATTHAYDGRDSLSTIISPLSLSAILNLL